MTMLELRDISVSYGKHRALDKAALSVKRGEIVVILGANGAGKSTLLKAVSGICEGAVHGSVRLNGEELLGLAPHKIVEAGVALVPEGRGVFGELSVQENLLLGAYSDRAKDEQDGNLDRVMSLFPRLDERRKQQVRTMSGGEQQMVAIGRAMMSSPQILMLDEPSLGLSPLLSKDLFQSLKTVSSAGIGILLVEQNAKASLAISDRGYLLENGQIVHTASAASLASDPAVQAAYLGGKPKSVAAPVTASAPRPASGPNPSEIAAAAMAKLAPPPRPAPAPKPATPAPATVQTAAPAQQRPAPAQMPKPAPANGKSTYGIAIDDLVARASAASRQTVTAPKVPQSTIPSRPAVAPASPPRPAMTIPPPDPKTDSRDRLAQVLSEIEEAARRAEAWRPNTQS
jgi:branched-chain amino acid transport system ATP-binding protein